SSGLHTNGYSLARRVFDGRYTQQPAELGGRSIGEALLEVHRPYLREITTLWDTGVPIHALAHITGGGIYDNLPRVLPGRLRAIIRRESWDIPPIFELLVRLGGLTEREAFHALNMGLGMLVVVPPGVADLALQTLPEGRLVGQVVPGGEVRLI